MSFLLFVIHACLLLPHPPSFLPSFLVSFPPSFLSLRPHPSWFLQGHAQAGRGVQRRRPPGDPRRGFQLAGCQVRLEFEGIDAAFAIPAFLLQPLGVDATVRRSVLSCSSPFFICGALGGLFHWFQFFCRHILICVSLLKHHTRTRRSSESPQQEDERYFFLS